MRTQAFRPKAFGLSACLLIGLAGCNDPPSTQSDPAGAIGDNEAARVSITTVKAVANSGTVQRLPAPLLGAFATRAEGCTSDYGPLVVKPTQFNFGWGRADFTTIERDGSTYRIDALLIGEGQPNGPQRERYVIAPQPDGTGIRLTMGDKAFDYNRCSGETSGVSVQDSTTGERSQKTRARDASTVARPDVPAGEGPALAVEGEGVRFFNRTTSAASPIPFGRPQKEVLAAMERVRGPADRGTNQDCGAGPVQYANWPDGLSLVFQGGSFAGWGLNGRAKGALVTAIGIGPGSTRAELEGAYANVEVKQTSLGTEFAGGGFFGVLDGKGPAARITDMWAGLSCVAR